MVFSLLRSFGFYCAWVLALGAIAWSLGAVYFDLPWSAGRIPVSLALGLLTAFLIWRVTGRWRKLLGSLAGFALVLPWWLTLQPSQNRPWQPDVDRLAWAEFQGDTVTIHNVRNCEYRAQFDYTPHWETRTVRLSQLTGMDLTTTHWGAPCIAHPIVSFQFADAPPLCFSIETRKEIGETYSALGGLYRRFELIYVVADERDVIRLRTNYRKNEETYLYRSTATPELARIRFLEYLAAVNALHQQPKWYNAVTTNCSTAFAAQRPLSSPLPHDWRAFLNGRGDELLYELGNLQNPGLTFPELREKSHLNPIARPLNDAPDFSTRIREKLPAFSSGAASALQPAIK